MSVKKSGRAIVTYSRGWQSVVVTRSLGRRGVEVITADEYAMTPASFSSYSVDEFRYPNVTDDPEGFLDALEEAVIRFKPKDESPYVLMPIHKETYLIAEHRERFEPHISVPVPRYDHIVKVHNKGTLAADAMEQKLPVPKTWLPKSKDDFEATKNSITLPAFVKLRESAAGVGVQKVDTQEELSDTFYEFIEHFKLDEEDYPIIQAAVPGEDYCVTTLFDQGELAASMTYHNLRAFPPEKGAGVMRETVKADRMEQISADLLGPMNWHGVAQLDFRWDGNETTEPALIEVNPRFWGGLIQAVESGWDYPWYLYHLAAHGHVPEQEEGRYDVRTETPVLAILATLQDMVDSDSIMESLEKSWGDAKKEFREGSKRESVKQFFRGLKDKADTKARLNEAKAMLEEHKHNVYDVLSSDDPKPALGVLYPLAVFLKHGKVNMELVTGESGPKPKDE